MLEADGATSNPGDALGRQRASGGRHRKTTGLIGSEEEEEL